MPKITLDGLEIEVPAGAAVSRVCVLAGGEMLETAE